MIDEDPLGMVMDFTTAITTGLSMVANRRRRTDATQSDMTRREVVITGTIHTMAIRLRLLLTLEGKEKQDEENT
jgi:hypothetical protein